MGPRGKMRETTGKDSSALDRLIVRQRMLVEQVRIHLDALAPGTRAATKANEAFSLMRDDLSKLERLRDTLCHQPYLLFAPDNGGRVH
jgi:hypothetical protein